MKDLPEAMRQLRREVADRVEQRDHDLHRFANSSALSQNGYNCLRHEAKVLSEVLELIDAICESHQGEPDDQSRN